VVRSVLAAEKDADLVVLSGDLVSGYANRAGLQGWFQRQCVPLLHCLSTKQLREHAFSMLSSARHMGIKIGQRTHSHHSKLAFALAACCGVRLDVVPSFQTTACIPLEAKDFVRFNEF
jgi:hypothetical protein